MTGYRSSQFRWDCEIKGCYYRSLPDWDYLLGSFPRGIKPTDVDGLVEIGRNFLFMEQKGPGVPIPDAQRKALLRAAERDGITTLFFRPPLNEATDLECLVFGQGRPDGWQACSHQGLKDWLSDWAAKADANPYTGDLDGAA